VVTALNKVDLLARHDGDAIRGLEELREHSVLLSYNRPDALLISAQNAWGLDELRRRIETVLDEGVAAITSARSRWSMEEKRPAD